MEWMSLVYGGVAGAIVAPLAGSLINAVTGSPIPSLSTDYTVQNIEIGFVTGVLVVAVMKYVLKA